jgi:hypothetical protein
MVDAVHGLKPLNVAFQPLAEGMLGCWCDPHVNLWKKAKGRNFFASCGPFCFDSPSQRCHIARIDKSYGLGLPTPPKRFHRSLGSR